MPGFAAARRSLLSLVHRRALRIKYSIHLVLAPMPVCPLLQPG